MRTVCAILLLALAACGTSEPKQAESPAPAQAEPDDSPKWDSSSESGEEAANPKPQDGEDRDSASTTERPPEAGGYDKHGVEVVLKRAARQVKENCGGATDDSGEATGPFGKGQVTVTLGWNGHSKGVTVGAPFTDTPPGRCAIQAFSNLTYPPWKGSDKSVDWEIEVVKPSKGASK